MTGQNAIMQGSVKLMPNTTIHVHWVWVTIRLTQCHSYIMHH